MTGFELSIAVVVLLVALALVFAFLNGFHDAANSIATVVSTGVLKPRQAVLWAAFFNVAAIFVFQLQVATTIGTGTVLPEVVDGHVIFGALVAAIFWNVLTWYYGIPSSSSHALIGGLLGAAFVKSGPAALVASGILKTLAFIVISPLLGLALGSGLMLLMSRMFFRGTPGRLDRWFRRLQLVSAALYSLGHGGNDAQKSIGLIWLLLIGSGFSLASEPVPGWVVVGCYGAIGLGTLFGGWRIVRTMGQKLTKLKPLGGFCAETGGALTIFLASALGAPISTTHTITGAIIGVGSVQRRGSVRWGLASVIVWAWVLTIPCAALVSAIAWWISSRIF